MKSGIPSLKALWCDERGMEMAEYCVTGALICMATAAVFIALAGAIGPAIDRMNEVMEGLRQ